MTRVMYRTGSSMSFRHLQQHQHSRTSWTRPPCLVVSPKWRGLVTNLCPKLCPRPRYQRTLPLGGVAEGRGVWGGGYGEGRERAMGSCTDTWWPKQGGGCGCEEEWIFSIKRHIDDTNWRTANGMKPSYSVISKVLPLNSIILCSIKDVHLV